MKSETGEVLSVNISEKKGTIKKPTEQITVSLNGIDNDAHAGKWHRQISLLAREYIELFEAEIGREIAPGEFAENITTANLDTSCVNLLDRFKIGDVELEVTQIGKKCHGGCEIFQQIGDCIMPREGVFAKVIKPGRIKPSDTIEVINPND